MEANIFILRRRDILFARPLCCTRVANKPMSTPPIDIWEIFVISSSLYRKAELEELSRLRITSATIMWHNTYADLVHEPLRRFIPHQHNHTWKVIGFDWTAYTRERTCQSCSAHEVDWLERLEPPVMKLYSFVNEFTELSEKEEEQLLDTVHECSEKLAKLLK